MSPAVPRTPSRGPLWTLVALATGLIGLIASACAPAGTAPNFPVQAARSLLSVQVVDQLNDVGRSPSVALTPHGDPVVAYLLYQQPAQPGVLPAPQVVGQAQPPAVMLAQGNGRWSRQSVTPQKVSPFVGDVPELANKKREAISGVNTALALDTQGKAHVLWATPTGVFYSDNTSGSFSPPDRISKAQAFGGSIAVGQDGTVWVAYYEGTKVVAATKGPSGWSAETVADTSGAPGLPAQVTAIRVGSNGPIVGYGDNGTTVVATKSGGWTTSRVPGQGGHGVSLALDKSGLPTVAYYSSAGDVVVADAIGGGQFQTTTVAHTAPGKNGAADPKWSTGIGIDSSGNTYVAFADTRAKDVALAVRAGSGYRVQALPKSEDGANPSLAVSQQGNQVALAWYDTVNENLDVAVTSTGPLILAFSPPPALTAVPQAGPTATGPACSPGGTTIQVVAPAGAAGSGFEKKCYAAPANTPFTIGFNNQDSGVPHNFEIFTTSAATTRLGGASGPSDIVTGPGTATYKVGSLKPGTYYFQCDVHPTTMNGQFVVAGR